MRITCAADAGLLVEGNVQLLALALSNLVDNALRHAPAGTEIAVAATAAGGPALVVADRGPGIPEADHARALQRFVRLDPSRGGPGAGLGARARRGGGAVARRHRRACRQRPRAGRDPALQGCGGVTRNRRGGRPVQRRNALVKALCSA